MSRGPGPKTPVTARERAFLPAPIKEPCKQENAVPTPVRARFSLSHRSSRAAEDTMSYTKEDVWKYHAEPRPGKEEGMPLSLITISEPRRRY